LPGVTKKDDELDPEDAYHKSMFGGDYKPKTKKTPEYCRQSAFKQAHSRISLFERRNTLEDLAKKSKASIHSMYSEDEVSGRPRNMSDADRRHKTLTELGNLQSLSNLLAATSPKGADKFSFDDENDADKPIPKLMRTLSQKNAAAAASGAGHLGQTGAGGAGALPASSDIINIVNSHFKNDDDDVEAQQNKKREASHMSYIYADEDSQHHKLPEYSMDQAEMANANHFEPKLPNLAENEENSHREASHASTTYQTESHTKHTVIDVSMDQFAHDEAETNNTSPRHKMIIKVYPPSLQAVASKSPSGANDKFFE
jgi:hypothetical protein